MLWQPQAGQQRESLNISRSKTSMSHYQREQDVSPEVTVRISAHSNMWMQRLVCQALLMQLSFEERQSFVDLVLPLGLRRCFSVTKSKKEISTVFISFKRCFPAYRKYLMGEDSSYITDHALQTACTFYTTWRQLVELQPLKMKYFIIWKGERNFMGRKSRGTNLPVTLKIS